MKRALALLMVVVSLLAFTPSSATANVPPIANALCSLLDDTTLVRSPVSFASHGDCIVYMQRGGVLWVFPSVEYWVVDSTGRIHELVLVNSTTPTDGVCTRITAFIESLDGSTRIEVVADPGETATATVPEGFGFTVNFVAGVPDGQPGWGLAWYFNSGVEWSPYTC